MSASQSGVYNTQQFTDMGVPLVGGRLYTFAFGTTTHKTAYTDHAGAISHTYSPDGLGGQFIALDARGELPAPLYLVGGSYDLALKTAAGATVWTRRADPVWDITSDLSAPDGASIIGANDYQTQDDFNRQFVSIKKFGAVGDGVTDDTAAFAAAKAFALAATYPVEIIFPAGKYVYSASPNWAINNLSLKSMGLVIFQYTGTGDAFICDADVFGAGNGKDGLSVGRFIIYAPSTAGCGALIRSVHHSDFELTVKGCGNGTWGTAIGINVLGCVCTTFTKPVVNQYAIFNGWHSALAPNVGMYFGSSASYGRASTCTVTNPVMEFTRDYGIHIVAADNILIRGGTCEQTLGTGIAIEYGCIANTIDGTDMELNTTAAVYINGASNSIINSVMIGVPGNPTWGLVILDAGAQKNTIINSLIDKLVINAGASYNVIDDCTVNTTNQSTWLTDNASGKNYIGKCVDLYGGAIGVPNVRQAFPWSASVVTILNTALNPLVLYLTTEVVSMTTFDQLGNGYTAPVGSQVVLYPNGGKVTLNFSVATGTIYGFYFSP